VGASEFAMLLFGIAIGIQATVVVDTRSTLASIWLVIICVIVAIRFLT
jgi:hypothetical protein